MLAIRGGSLIGCRVSTIHWLPVQGRIIFPANQLRHTRSSTKQQLTAHVLHATDSAATWSRSIQPISPEDVPTPLCKRLPKHEAPVHSVLSWHRAMGARVAEIGDRFVQQDLGPSESELKRELDWVLDDTIVAIKYHHGDPWMPCTWRFLEAEVSAATHGKRDMSSWSLQLRASVEQLHEWWTLRLQDRVPFQYLIASAHWRQHVLSVGPGVLIPRPETEIFADLVSEALKQRPSLASIPWVDMGTGSGAIAIAAAEALCELNQSARVFAVDLSPVAVAYATTNARTTGYSDHVSVLRGSWFEPVAKAIAALQQLGTSSPGAVSEEQCVQKGEPESSAAQKDGHRGGVAHSRSTTKTDGWEKPAAPAVLEVLDLLSPPGQQEQPQHRGTEGPAVDTQHPHPTISSQSPHASDQPPSAESQPALSIQHAGSTQSEVSASDHVSIDHHRRDHFQPAGRNRLSACLGGVLSNPPYIPTSTMKAGLQAEVGLHEPWGALDGGTGTGLDSLKAICTGAVDMLVPGGFIALETAGKEQALLVASLLQTLEDPTKRVAAFTDVKVLEDCFGIQRFVSASRTALD